MNKSLITAALIAFIAAGCATTGNNTPLESQLIIDAAQAGTYEVVKSNPQDVAYFVAAEAVLNAVSGSTNQISATTIEAALAAAGQNNSLVTLGVTDALGLADAYIQSNTNSPSSVQTAAGWIATGIGEGLQLNAQVKAKLKK